MLRQTSDNHMNRERTRESNDHEAERCRQSSPGQLIVLKLALCNVTKGQQLPVIRKGVVKREKGGSVILPPLPKQTPFQTFSYLRLKYS